MNAGDRRPTTVGITKDEHDALVTLRNGRPLTQDPMQRRRTTTPETPKRSWLENFIDQVIGRERGSE